MKCRPPRRKISGFDYVVSKDGKVFRKVGDGHRKISPATNDDGYKTVVLYKDSKPHFKYVHNLVANAWNGDSNGKPIVNHKDGDKSNDDADNLEYASAAQNTQHAYKRGLAKPPKGEINGKAELTSKQVASIKKSKKTGVELASLYNTTPENISMIRNNKRW
jgi:hypothetical protein